jgi:capsid protein
MLMVFMLELLNIDKDPGRFEEAQWVTPGWPWVDPEKDMKAAERAIRDGLSTRSIECAAQGYDASVIDAEQKADNRADRMGLSYDSDGRKILTGQRGNDRGRSREGRHKRKVEVQ